MSKKRKSKYDEKVTLPGKGSKSFDEILDTMIESDPSLIKEKEAEYKKSTKKKGKEKKS